IPRAPQLNAQEIGNALYGLQKLTASAGTEAVLTALAAHIRRATQLDGQGIGNALYGLQKLTASVGTEAVLTALAAHIPRAPQLSGQQVGNALYGLHNLTASAGTEAVLTALATHIPRAAKLTAQEVSNALYGLQNLTASAGTEAVLSALAAHIPAAPQLSWLEVCNALYGLQRLATTPGVQSVLRALSAHVLRLPPVEPTAGRTWLAEAVNSLAVHLRAPATLAFLAVLADRADMSVAHTAFPQLLRDAHVDAALLALLDIDITAADIQIDLHGLSHSLSRRLVAAAISRLVGGNMPSMPHQNQLTIICGRGSHNPVHRHTMRRLVLEELARFGVDEPDLSVPGCVRVRRSQGTFAKAGGARA
ncbi:hypothetical protein J5T34_15020, partial [Cupriavidus gilardii]|uniref:hypothetical protein n=1 Tax=Cupriavidus gilardii TaxID=82541 RepID=UPI001ABE3FF1